MSSLGIALGVLMGVAGSLFGVLLGAIICHRAKMVKEGPLFLEKKDPEIKQEFVDEETE